MEAIFAVLCWEMAGQALLRMGMLGVV